MTKTTLSPLFWLLAFVAAAVNLRAPVVVIGPLVEPIMADLSLGAGSVSLLSTGMVICFGVLSPLAPMVSARLGLDGAIAFCLAAIAAGGILRGIHQFDLMLVGTLLAGAGIAFGNVFMPSLVKRDRPGRVGPMMGLYAVAMGVGATAAAGTAIPLVKASGTWSIPIWLWSGVALISCLIWSCLASRRQPAPMSDEQRYPLTALIRNRAAWLLTVYMGIQSLGFYTLQAWLPAVVVDAGVSPSRAGVMLSVLNLLTIPASYVTAHLAARMQRQSKLAVALTSLIVIALIGLLLAPTLSPMLWALLLGIGQGGCFSLALTLIVLRTRRPEHAAALSAMAQSIGYTVAAAGPWLFGTLQGLTGEWQASLQLLIGLLLVQMATGYGIGRAGAIEPPRSCLPMESR